MHQSEGMWEGTVENPAAVTLCRFLTVNYAKRKTDKQARHVVGD
jgi:hypothetical protein